MEKVYDLEERTFQFARDCRDLFRLLVKNVANIEDGKQLIRASGSVGANYIEANEKLGAKDLKMRLKISRKEAKEATYWLRLLKASNPEYKEIDSLIIESNELKKILSSIINKLP